MNELNESQAAELPALSLQKNTLDAIESRLNSLPPRQKMTLGIALQRLAPAIKKMREKGYSAAEVAAELTRELRGLGMTVSSRTLARLLPPKSAKKVPLNAKRKSALLAAGGS